MGMLNLVLIASLATAAVPASDTPTATGATAQTVWLRGLIAQMQAGDSPRQRALSVTVVPQDAYARADDRARRGKILRDAAAAAPMDRLVQGLWAQADEADAGCDAIHPCPDRRAAWARLEPENSAAWRPLLQQAELEHDDALRRQALAAAAQARYHDDLFGESVDAWLTVFESHPLPESLRRQLARDMAGESPGSAASIESPEPVMAIAFSVLATMQTLDAFRACRNPPGQAPDAERDEQCRRVGEQLLAAPTFLERSQGLAMLRAGAAREVLEAGRQMDWLQWQFTPQPYGNGALLVDLKGYVADLRTTHSEVRSVELLLQRMGTPLTPPAGWQRPKVAAVAEER